MLVEVDYRERRTFREQLHKLHARLMRDMSRSGICGLDVLAELNRQDSSATRAASPVAFVAMLEPPRTGTTDLFQLEGRNMVFSALETPQVVLDHQAIRRDDGGVALVWDVMDQAFEPGVVEAMFSAYVRHLDLLIEDECFWDSTIFDCRSTEQVGQNHIYNKSGLTLRKGRLQSYLKDIPLHLDEKVAVVDGDVEITYGALRRITNRLAWTLKEKWNAGAGECCGCGFAERVAPDCCCPGNFADWCCLCAFGLSPAKIPKAINSGTVPASRKPVAGTGYGLSMPVFRHESTTSMVRPGRRFAGFSAARGHGLHHLYLRIYRYAKGGGVGPQGACKHH